MLSLEPPSQASTQPVHSAPVFAVASLKKSFQPFSKASKTWGILVDTGAATSVAPRSFAAHVKLSSVPATLKLTTATGKAIETFGVRTVQLHTEGISFQVAFVIADVVTPLLGLDSLLHERLSLHLGDSKHYLVAPGGAKTKLEHKGKHLYLIACPSQLGSSNLVCSSLSHVSGFLPSDMQLDHDDALSSSASSFDHDDDLVQQEAFEDTWYSHCHPVFEEASEAESEPSFDLVPGRTEVADAGGELQSESFKPKYLRQPKQPSKQERELHSMTHIPFQPWCVVCQEAKGRASQHRKKQALTKTSKLQLDYAYIRHPQDKEASTILTWVESLTGLAGSLFTDKKGVTQAQLDAVITFIKRQGFAQSTLQCDGEPALVKLVEEIGKRTSLPTRQSPAYSHQSQAYVEGWHRSLFAQFRALLFDFCHRYKLEPSDIKMGGSFSQHMLRHAVWLLNRFQLHSSDQKTSFQRRWGVPFSNPVLPFGELVLAQTQHAESAKLDHRLQPQRSLAIWLGRCEATGEHILAKANNTSLVKSRTVTRLSLEEACNLATFKTISIPPPELASAASVKMSKEGDGPPEGGEPKLRLDLQPQAFTQPPQQRARGRPKLQPPPFQPALAPPPGLEQPSTSTSLPKQPAAASRPVALQPKAPQPPPPPLALQQPALQQQPVRRRITQKGPGPAATKLHSILEKARSLHELEVAVNASEEELYDAKEALKDVHLQAYYEDDLSLFAEEDIKKAMLKEGESLHGTYEPVSKASFTKQQLRGVIQTRWVVQPRPAAAGETSLRARFVAKGFKQQILDPSLETYASTPSHLSLRVLLILSLVNHWDVVTADISSAFLQAPIPEGELVLVKPPPELEQDPDVLWKLRKALYGLKTSPKLWQQHLSDKLQELGLRKNKADPCIFMGDKLLVMTYVDDLLIVGEKLEQEAFLAKLSAQFPLKHQTKLDAQTPLTFLGKLVEYNQQEHSISLHLPTAYYQKLFKLYGMEQAKPAATTGDKLGQSDDPNDPANKALDPERHKLYRTAVGKLLWATPVRPDISFAVKELSRSLQSPTLQDEKQLKHVLRYLRGSLQYTTCLQPPRKRVVEQASTIEIQAFADSDWAGCAKTRRSTSGASLCLWGVTIATSSRTQATQALSSAEAELYAMGMAIQDALHLQSLLQELKLTQLAKPFELTVYTDSSSGKALASKLGLTRKSKHVQLRFLFMQDLVATGQLKLSRVPSEKNPADILTKYLQASTLHKLLPKLGVVTRAVDSKDLLSMLSFGGRVSSGPSTQQLLYRHVGRKPCFSTACCITSLQQKELAILAAYAPKAKKKKQFEPLPREALQGAALFGSAFALQLCLVYRSSSGTLTLSFMALCFPA